MRWVFWGLLFWHLVGAADDVGPRANTVALLLTGQYDAFNRTICALNHHVVAPLVHNGSTVHIFGVSSSDSDRDGHMALLKNIPHAQVHLHVVPAPEIPAECAQYADTNYVSAQFSATKKPSLLFLENLFYKWRAEALCKEFGAAHGLRFDWIVWLPVNVLFMEPFPELAMMDPSMVNVPEWSTNVHAVNDKMAVTTSATSHAYFGLYNSLCSQNLKYPPKSDGERILKGYSSQAQFNFAKTVTGFRFVLTRAGDLLPMKQETPAFFKPENLLCKNYRYMRIAWRVRSMQLECQNPRTLEMSPDNLYPIPDCVWPTRKSMRGRNSTQIAPKLLARGEGKAGFN